MNKLLNEEQIESYEEDKLKEDIINIEQNTKQIKNNYLICIKCNEKKLCSKDRYQKLIEKYKSEEELNKNYVCRNCRKK